MKKILLGLAMLLFAGAASAQGQPKDQSRPLKIVLARGSTADPVEIVKHLSRNCPNITLTSSVKESDFMVYAGGWSGAGYRFMVIAPGGDTIYATETTLLSNAVKDVCRYLNTHAPPPHQ